jgi:hypothetical protein
VSRKYFRLDADLEACSLTDIIKIKLLHRLVKLVSLNKHPYVAFSPRILDLVAAHMAHRHGMAYDFLTRGMKLLKKYRQRPGK